MTKDQVSLLLYLETRAVDYSGVVATEKMNDEDMAQAKVWAEEGFIDFGRICFKDIKRTNTHWVKLTEEAFAVAHNERIALATRLWNSRNWLKTSEKNQEQLCKNEK